MFTRWFRGERYPSPLSSWEACFRGGFRAAAHADGCLDLSSTGIRHAIFSGGAKCLAGIQGAFLSLLLIVVVLGGILKGVFTATEAAAIAVAYAWALSAWVYREVGWRDLPELLLQAGITTAVVFLLIATSMAMSWILTLEDIPQQVSTMMLGISENPVMLLLLINVLLLAAGTFMDMTPGGLDFYTDFLACRSGAGNDPRPFRYHDDCQPVYRAFARRRVGTCLFVGCGVGKTRMSR